MDIVRKVEVTKGRRTEKSLILKNKSRIFFKTQKAEFYFNLSKIESKGTFSRKYIAQLLPKCKNMAEK